LGLKKKRAVLFIYGICISLGLSAILVQGLHLNFNYAVIVMAGAALSMLVLGIRLAMVDTGRFGRNRGRDDVE
jgi:hypothetical protein